MTSKEFMQEVETLLELDAGTISGKETLADLQGWDSMAAIGFIAMADAVAGIVIVPADLAKCKTVVDLAALVHVEGL